MVIELKGQQIRIRVKNPRLFKPDSFRTHDVGTKGKLQRITGKMKIGNGWQTQAWRLNLGDYRTIGEFNDDLLGLLNNNEITKPEAMLAGKLFRKWVTKNKN